MQFRIIIIRAVFVHANRLPKRRCLSFPNRERERGERGSKRVKLLLRKSKLVEQIIGYATL